MREILASPMGIFSANDTSIYVYAELYNMHYEEDLPDSFNLSYRVYTEDGYLYRNFGNYSSPKPGSSAVITNALDVKGWPSGKYDLNLVATDPSTGSTAEATRRLVIFPRTGSRAGLVTYTKENLLDTASLKTKSQLIKYLVEPQDWVLFETLTDIGKGEFVERFFLEKDPDPATKENEYLMDALNRYDYANKHFFSPFGENEGWRTDMGRVLLQYGVAEHSREGVLPSYMEAWTLWSFYSLQGGIYFIFVDREGYGEYRLVHSNADGEPQDKEYENLIYGIDVNEPEVAE
jgi:GWxTD domain-containing protein